MCGLHATTSISKARPTAAMRCPMAPRPMMPRRPPASVTGRPWPSRHWPWRTSAQVGLEALGRREDQRPRDLRRAVLGRPGLGDTDRDAVRPERLDVEGLVAGAREEEELQFRQPGDGLRPEGRAVAHHRDRVRLLHRVEQRVAAKRLGVEGDVGPSIRPPTSPPSAEARPGNMTAWWALGPVRVRHVALRDRETGAAIGWVGLHETDAGGAGSGEGLRDPGRAAFAGGLATEAGRHRARHRPRLCRLDELVCFTLVDNVASRRGPWRASASPGTSRSSGSASRMC